MADVLKKMNNAWYIVLIAPNNLTGALGLGIKLDTIHATFRKVDTPIGLGIMSMNKNDYRSYTWR
jgi:hypothetical protein